MARRIATLKHRIRRALSEMDYAGRRAFEIGTGLPASNRLERARDKALIAELEAHWRM
jgi:BMFP domain-containing protein YqiC